MSPRPVVASLVDAAKARLEAGGAAHRLEQRRVELRELGGEIIRQVGMPRRQVDVLCGVVLKLTPRAERGGVKPRVKPSAHARAGGGLCERRARTLKRQPGSYPQSNTHVRLSCTLGGPYGIFTSRMRTSPKIVVGTFGTVYEAAEHVQKLGTVLGAATLGGRL